MLNRVIRRKVKLKRPYIIICHKEILNTLFLAWPNGQYKNLILYFIKIVL